MYTMRDIALLAGTSKASVSRVINNKPVSEDIKCRVEQALSGLNYKPNGIAQLLATKSKNLIGLIVPARPWIHEEIYDLVIGYINSLALENKMVYITSLSNSNESFIECVNEIKLRSCTRIIYFKDASMSVNLQSETIRAVLNEIKTPIAIVKKHE